MNDEQDRQNMRTVEFETFNGDSFEEVVGEAQKFCGSNQGRIISINVVGHGQGFTSLLAWIPRFRSGMRKGGSR